MYDIIRRINANAVPSLAVDNAEKKACKILLYKPHIILYIQLIFKKKTV